MSQRITLILADTGTDPRPLPIRLRQALKILLRGFGIRCISITEDPAPSIDLSPVERTDQK